MVWRIVRKAAKRAGIEKAVSCHWLRHAHASHALDRGAPIHLVQATLGHSSIQTTGRYLHARPTDSSSRYPQFLVTEPFAEIKCDLFHDDQSACGPTAHREDL